MKKTKNEKHETPIEKHDVDFFKKEYDSRNPICDGVKCNVIGDCIMHPREKKEAIIQGLAEITVEMNQKISELFKRTNNGQLPIAPPVFKLTMYHCPSHKSPPIDFGD